MCAQGLLSNSCFTRFTYVGLHVLFKDTVPQHKRRTLMFKAVRRIVKSSDIRQQRKFSKLLLALKTDHQHVAEALRKAFNAAALNHLVSGEFPKVRI